MKIGDLVSVKGTTLVGKVIDFIDPFSICDRKHEMVSVMIEKDNRIEIFKIENLEKLERQIGRSKE